jgi:hypothetical protein
MTPLFHKLNLKHQTEIVILNAPDTFKGELTALNGISVLRDVESVEAITFSLAFVTKQEEVNEMASTIAKKAQGDAVIWFAYPKGSSKKYKCEFNRDNGWEILGQLGYEGVRQVAIDEDWSALRFRRVEFIKKMSREEKRAISEQGKARATEN